MPTVILRELLVTRIIPAGHTGRKVIISYFNYSVRESLRAKCFLKIRVSVICLHELCIFYMFL